MTDCMGLGFDDDMECGETAVCAIRLGFNEQKYSWAPACPHHAMNVAMNMAMADALKDRRYTFDWCPLTEMPDLEQCYVVPPEFRTAMEKDTPEDMRMPESVREMIMRAQLSRLTNTPNQN